MKPIRQTLKWMVILLLAGLLCSGGYAYWLWTRSDTMLRNAVLAKLAELQPDWNVSIGRARFDWHRRVHLYDVVLAAEGQNSPILRLPELVLTMDRRTLIEGGPGAIQRVRLVEPEVRLVRDPRGRWNWEDLLPLPQTEHSCPEWIIENGRLRIRLAGGAEGADPRRLSTTFSNLQLVPSGRRQYAIRGTADIEQVGPLRLDGRWDLDAATWMFNGRLNDIAVDDSLAELVTDLLPAAQNRLARLNAALADIRSGAGSGPAAEPGRPSADEVKLQANLDVNFRIARRSAEAGVELQCLLTVRQGQLVHRALPFPLRNLEGQFYWDDRQIVVRHLRAQNGVTQLAIDGEIDRSAQPADPGGLQIAITDLVLDDRFAGCLPPTWRDLYRTVQPSGPVDVEGSLAYRGKNGWTPEGFVLTAKGCTGTHEKFPYPVQEIVGTIRQNGQQVELRLKGRMGQQRATLAGWVTNPGPRAEALYEIRVDGLPLDETFRRACRPEIRDTIDFLNLRQAAADAVCRLYRPPGPDRKFQLRVAADVRHAELQCEAFPYRLSDVSGRILFSSQSGVWTFENLEASHGAARLTGSATFTHGEGRTPDRLQLKVVSEDVPLDEPLRRALPDSLRELWGELSPGGTLNAVAKLDWTPGGPPVVSIPEARVRGGSLEIRAFPYHLDHVATRFSYDPRRELVTIPSFSAQHGKTAVTGRGRVRFAAGGGWALDIRELHVDDLIPDRPFRDALPSDLRTVIDKLDPQGSISLSGQLGFRVAEERPVPLTADWDLELVFSGGALTAGVPIEDLQGKVTTRGTWNGWADMDGRIMLDSMTVWDKQFTQVQGPYSVDGHQVTIGSAEAATRGTDQRSREQVPPAEQLTARAIGGTFSLNAVVSLLKPAYDVRIVMREGRLERYARRYLPGTNNIRGVMDGWLVLHGQGAASEDVTGRGQVQISPAALYELPVIVRIFKVLNLSPPDQTAFTYAFFDFDVAEEQFQFDQILLDGNAVRLGGRGTARFNGQLDLKFGARLPASRLPIPLVQYVLDKASQGWVGIEVTGPVSNPDVTYRAAPVVDETMKELLRSLEAGSAGAIRQFMRPGMSRDRHRRRPSNARP